MKKVFYLISFISLLSCGGIEYVRFETSQPETVHESKLFSKKVQGDYISCSDQNDKLTITNNLILNTQILNLNAHRNDIEFDSLTTINRNDDNELKMYFIKLGYEIEIKGDTIYAFYSETDTIFQVSEEQVLKKFKGSYFLNYKLEDNFWEVVRLNFTKDTLLLGQIFPNDTLLHYDFVSKTEEFANDDSSAPKSIEYLMKPHKKKEFKELLKSNSFLDYECYYKQ